MIYPLFRELAAEKIPVAVTCRVLGFSKQAFYKRQGHVSRSREVADDDFGAERAQFIGGLVASVVHHCSYTPAALAQERHNLVATPTPPWAPPAPVTRMRPGSVIVRLRSSLPPRVNRAGRSQWWSGRAVPGGLK
jgi:hypothetical protein